MNTRTLRINGVILVGLGLLTILQLLVGAGMVFARQEDRAFVYLPIIVRGGSAAPTPTPSPTPASWVPESVFGVNLSSSDAAGGLTEILTAGASWIHASQAVQWAAVEPVEGERHWETLAGLEAELLAAANLGLRVILTVEGTPDWAGVTGILCEQPLPGKFPAMVAFLRDLVQRYSAPPYRVKHWELWSEPDAASTCWIDPSEPYYAGGGYALLLAAAYPQIKAADPEAQVLVGSLRLECDPNNPPGGKDCSSSNFLEGILQTGSVAFDGVSFQAADGFAVYDLHWGTAYQYSNNNWHSDWLTSGPSLIVKANFIRGLLEEYRARDKALYNIQSALLCASCEDVPVFETAKAGYIAQVYAASVALDLETNLWESLTGWQNSGLLKPDFTPLPAYRAFQIVRERIGTAVCTGEVLPSDVGGAPGIRGYKFSHPDGRQTWLLWYVSVSEPSHAVTFATQPGAAWDMLGNPLNLSTGLVVGVDPVYVEWTP